MTLTAPTLKEEARWKKVKTEEKVSHCCNLIGFTLPQFSVFIVFIGV